MNASLFPPFCTVQQQASQLRSHKGNHPGSTMQGVQLGNTRERGNPHSTWGICTQSTQFLSQELEQPSQSGAEDTVGGQGTSALLETPCSQSSPVQTQCYIFPALLRQPGRSRELNSRAWSKIREARFGFNTEGGLKR